MQTISLELVINLLTHFDPLVFGFEYDKSRDIFVRDGIHIRIDKSRIIFNSSEMISLNDYNAIRKLIIKLLPYEVFEKTNQLYFGELIELGLITQ